MSFRLPGRLGCHYYAAMRNPSTIALILLSIAAGSFAARAQVRDGQVSEKGHTLVLFGASWCAPCIAEVRAIGALAAVASPDRIVIAWTDAGVEKIPIVRPANVEIAAPERAHALWRAYSQGAAGYPFSVMLDDAGKRCAHWARPLSPEAVGAMRRTCLGRSP
jgi:thiol-disulfide isomerase/thioredoxin